VSEILNAYDVWRWRARVTQREKYQHPQNGMAHELQSTVNTEQGPAAGVAFRL
jgi:hypothetical protein